MPRNNNSTLSASDVQTIVEVSRTKAISIIQQLGGAQDPATGRWRVDARRFYSWYNAPCSIANAEGGEIMIQVDRIVSEIQKYAAGEQVSFSLHRPPRRSNWHIRVYRGRHSKIVSLRTTDKKQAKAIDAEIRSRFQRAVVEGIIATNTSKFFEQWLAGKETEIKPSSHKKYRSVVDKALKVMPAEVHYVKRQNIEQYKQLLIREGYAPKSIHEELCVLHSAFENAKLLGYTNVNPLDGVSRPSKQPRQPVKAYSEAELEALFAELEKQARNGRREHSDIAWRTYIELFHCMNYTGIRVSDAVKLRWHNVSLAFGTMSFVQTKTGKDTLIRIPTVYVERLKKLYDSQNPQPDDLVYPSTTGNPVTDNSLNGAIRKALKNCGITKKSPIHAFRHTVAMRLLGAGLPVHEVASQLGDTVETIVRAYVKPMLPSRADVDAAYGQGSRKGHANMEEMEGFAAVGATSDLTLKRQETRITKGILSVCQESRPSS